jgi:Spy/CpxP family protein refolding chaperone
MEFSSDRRKAAALVALVFVLGIAFGVVGVLAGRRVLGAGNRSGGNGNGNGQGQQVSQLTRDLHLTADQERQFRQVLSDTRDRYNAIRRAMDPQFSQVRQQNRDRIRQILTAEQKPLFEGFLSESRNRRNDNNNNRRNDQSNRGNQNGNQNGNRNGQTSQVARLTQQLSLTAEQQTQLSGILRDTRASFDALRQQMNPQFEEARVQNRERLRQVVTAEQRQGLDAFFQRRDEERRRRQ